MYLVYRSLCGSQFSACGKPTESIQFLLKFLWTWQSYDCWARMICAVVIICLEAVHLFDVFNQSKGISWNSVVSFGNEVPTHPGKPDKLSFYKAAFQTCKNPGNYKKYQELNLSPRIRNWAYFTKLKSVLLELRNLDLTHVAKWSQTAGFHF